MLSAIRNTALAATVGLSLVAVPKADAAYVAYLYQDGANVVAAGSGSINRTALTFDGTGTDPAEVAGTGAVLILNTPYDAYSHTIVGPTSFGGVGGRNANTASGPAVAICGSCEQLAVPVGYVSGTSLGTSTATWDSTTLATLGVTDGTYTWTWGTGANADSFTLHIGEAPPTGAPEPASLTMLALGLAGLGMALRTRRV